VLSPYIRETKDMSCCMGHVTPAGRCIIQCTRTNLSSSSPPDTSSVTMKTRFSVSQTAWSFMQWGWSTCCDSSATSSRRGRRKQSRITSMMMMGPDLRWCAQDSGSPFSGCLSHAVDSRRHADTENVPRPKHKCTSSVSHVLARAHASARTSHIYVHQPTGFSAVIP
jgi:hypothetical protein